MKINNQLQPNLIGLRNLFLSRHSLVKLLCRPFVWALKHCVWEESQGPIGVIVRIFQGIGTFEELDMILHYHGKECFNLALYWTKGTTLVWLMFLDDKAF